MSRVIDLEGFVFGRLTVVSRAENDKFGETKWLCNCSCGKMCVVSSSNLRKGRQKSCGCLRHQSAWNRTHNESNCTRLYRIWTGMKTRCYNKNCKPYQRYGGRGIFICDEWRDDYEAFRDWSMSSGYAENLSIDRIDNNLSYSPENCRWATQMTQCNNRRSNRVVVIDSEKMTAAQASRMAGVDYNAFMKKIYRDEAKSC